MSPSAAVEFLPIGKKDIVVGQIYALQDQAGSIEYGKEKNIGETSVVYGSMNSS
jgi:hypothetical protein